MAQSNLDLSKAPLTMEQFCKNIQNGFLACVEFQCGHRTFLANSFCTTCKKPSNQTGKWIKVDWTGKIVSYCVTYVGPPELNDIVPYGSLIVDFGEGLRISAVLQQKLDPANPPLDLIGKKVKPSILDRPNVKILGMRIEQ